MVLVGVGQHDAQKVGAAFLDEGRIGHHDLDAGHGVVGEADAEVDHQPLAGMAVEIEVHADLARAAQREEEELVLAGNGHAAFLLRFQISISPRAVMSVATWSITEI